MIGYISSRGKSSDAEAAMLVAFRRGLNESAYVEGQNLTVEDRFADGQYDRLPALLTDITRRQVSVIAFAGLVVSDALVRQMRASQIPIVFTFGADPVRAGLVSSINRPGGNITGIANPSSELTAKQTGLLREIVPGAKTIALLMDSPRLVSRPERQQDVAATAPGDRQTRPPPHRSGAG